MLDRLALGIVSLPSSAYDIVVILMDADGSRSESQRLVDRQTLTTIVRALKPGGRLRSEDGIFGTCEGPEQTEAILAGLVIDGKNGLMKPDYGEQHSVPLRLGKKTKKDSNVGTRDGSARDPVAQSTSAANSRQSGVNGANTFLTGVGFVDFTDDFGTSVAANSNNYSDGELIDEDTLLGEEDVNRPIIQPPECRPKAGKRRRACKDCTCGLAQRLEADDAAKRANADKALDAMKLDRDDLAEVDFTVQGKVGSCGNCALGDAFRCDGCPYIGLPAFKPGEEVRLSNNDVQL
ncbi:hypothetical protein VTN00DRAFT_4563 [Thermoascus crustaceus]|uniref:uncharacterized protein n=1 Tax=Thermoascus crustaceus TaxID=5088 RepID=UPI003742D00D